MLRLLLAITLGFALSVDSMSALASSKKSKKKKKEEITNARLRQSSGAKKKWSFTGSFGYIGGTLSDPFSAKRPSIYNPLATSDVLVSGSLGIRYRLTSRASLSTGFGLLVLNPLHGTSKKALYINDPYLGLSYYAKLGGFQQGFSLSAEIATNERSKADEYQAGVGFQHSFLWNPKPKVTVGLYTSLEYSHYGECADAGETSVISDDSASENCVFQQADYEVGLIPFFEYAFTDRYSFRTVFNWFTYYRQKVVGKPQSVDEEDGPWEITETNKIFRNSRVQSIGLGIAVTRDIYVYPNFQFNIEEINLKKTNVGISVSLSL